MCEEMDLRKTKPVRHPLIDACAQMYGNIEQRIFDEVKKMSDGDLQMLKDAANSLSMCNCWYAEYEVKPLVLERIRVEQLKRAKANASSNSATSGPRIKRCASITASSRADTACRTISNWSWRSKRGIGCIRCFRTSFLRSGRPSCANFAARRTNG